MTNKGFRCSVINEVVRTCREPVSLLTPLRNKYCDLSVAPPPKRLHCQRYASTGEEPMKAVAGGEKGR